MLVNWKKCWRLIDSCYPPIKIYERIASEEDFEALVALESLTNSRIREELGLIIVAPEDRISGTGAGYIMAAFTHPNKDGSRFSNGSYGVYYAAKHLKTSIEEIKYHRLKFFRDSGIETITSTFRVLVAELKGDLEDIRNENQEIYAPDNYSASQKFGLERKKAGSYGLLYKSVRDAEGECVAVFRPPVLKNCRTDHFIDIVYEKGEVTHLIKKEEIF